MSATASPTRHLSRPPAISASAAYYITPRTGSSSSSAVNNLARASSSNTEKTRKPNSSSSSKKPSKVRGPHNAALVGLVSDVQVPQVEFENRDMHQLVHLLATTPALFPPPATKPTRAGPINPSYDIAVDRRVLARLWSHVAESTRPTDTLTLGVRVVPGIETAFPTLLIVDCTPGSDRIADDDDSGKLMLESLAGSGAIEALAGGNKDRMKGGVAVAFEFAGLRWLVRYPLLPSVFGSSHTHHHHHHHHHGSKKHAAVGANTELWVRKQRKQAGERAAFDDLSSLTNMLSSTRLASSPATEHKPKPASATLELPTTTPPGGRSRADSASSDRSDASGVSSSAASFIESSPPHRGETPVPAHRTTTTTTTAARVTPFDTPVNALPHPPTIARAVLAAPPTTTTGSSDDEDDADEKMVYASTVATRDALAKLAGKHDARVARLANLVVAAVKAAKKVCGSDERRGKMVRVGGEDAGVVVVPYVL